MIPQFTSAFASGINPDVPDFYAPLADGGEGAVDTTLTFGSGSATFTRATEAATRLSTGLWKLDVASGTARSHYHEYTAGVMTYGGYLGEAAATQLALLPRDMTNVAWVAGATMTVAQDGTGLDGAANSCSRLTAGAVEATNIVLQTLVVAAASRTYSAWIKRVTGTGTVAITQDGSAYTDVTSQLNTTSFVQVQLNATQENPVFGIRMTTSTDVILVDCNQFENGASGTTPIPAAGSRGADAFSYDAANVAAANGTCYADCSLSVKSSASNAITFVDGGSAATGILLGIVSSGAVTDATMDDGPNVLTKSSLTSLLTGVRKRASAWGATTQSITGDGAAVASGSFDGAMTATGVRICTPSTTTGTCAKEVKIWTAKATSPQLVTITT